MPETENQQVQPECPPGTKFCFPSCINRKVCKEIHDKEMDNLFTEIMDEAEAQRPKIVWDHCPCVTCIYNGKTCCVLENEEPFKSQKKEGCPDWDEGETEYE